MSKRKPSICFVALKAYGLLSGRDDIRSFGGAEVQQVLIGCELARRGYRVSFVTLDHGQGAETDCDGIRVLRAYGEKDGLPLTRFIHPRWTSIWSAMRAADADVYYQRTAGLETGVVASWCRRHRRPFVFAAASRYDCQRSPSHLTNLRSRFLFRYGIRRAARVITQTCEQQQLLKLQHGLDSIHVRSCTQDPGRVPDIMSGNGDAPHILWLGRFSPVKGLDRLLDVASQCSDIFFDLVGDYTSNDSYARRIRARAETMSNVRMYGLYPHTGLDPFYRRAMAVMCTSEFEGFPNTFLEAWARRVPVVSRIDPDGVVRDHATGLVAVDTTDLAYACRKLACDSNLQVQLGTNARMYFEQHHTVTATVDQYERVFADVFRMSS